MDRMRALRGLAGAVLLLCALGCARARNYPDPGGPRYAGSFAAAPAPEAIRVVTFNVKFARRVAAAARLLRDDPRLAGADLVLLQEMDAAGSECIARALLANFVYYPAVRHPADGKDFGNAILSRWPIEDDRKLVLPHLSRTRGGQRIAVAATVRVRGEAVRVYSVHLETPGALSGPRRRAQAAAVRADALAGGHRRVVIAGDFNARGLVGEVFAGDGFTWLTREVGRTISRFSWDHVVVRGLRPKDCASVAAVGNDSGASDHRPVVVDLVPADPEDPSPGQECGP